MTLARIMEPFLDCIEKVDYTSKIQRGDFQRDGRYPIISQEEDFINGYWDDPAAVFHVKRPVVVFGDHTKVLKYIDFDFVLGADGVKILQPRDFLHPKFFYHWLQSLELESLGYARHYRLLKDKLVPRLPMPEQQSIVARLDSALQAIAVARANAEKNLANARELFESKLMNIFGRSDCGWAESTFADKSLLRIIDGDRGVNYPNLTDFRSAGHCLFLNTKNVRRDGFLFKSQMFITEEKDCSLRKGRVERGDIVMTTRGTIGNIGIYTDDIPYERMRINSGMLILRTNQEKLAPEFLFTALRSQAFRDQVRERTSGTAQPQLPITTLVKLTLRFPESISEQRAVVESANELQLETGKLENVYLSKVSALDELKRSLFHNVFDGAL